MSRFFLAASSALLVFTACPPGPGSDGGTGGGGGSRTGGGGGGGALAAFEISDLDVDARDLQYTAIAVDPLEKRVGVAYFSLNGTMMGIEDGGSTPNFDLKYVEWKDGAIVTPPQKVRSMQRVVGLTAAFNPTTGEPTLSYLGGDPGFEVGKSIFWFQSDAVINQRTNGTTWTESVIVTDSDEVNCGNPVSDIGFLVGLWPAIAYDPTGKLYLGYRDGHNGNFPQQDWAGSDVEVWEGKPLPSTGTCTGPGGDVKKAYGGHMQMVIGAGDQPAIIYDQMFGTADTNGNNVFIQYRKTDGSWVSPQQVMPVSNTQLGASLAYDAMTEGYGIAVFSRSDKRLFYTSATDLTVTNPWNALDTVFAAGSGGWYPSLAMDPINHEPAIAFYICSNASDVNESNCPDSKDALMIRQRIGNEWREQTVDEGGGWSPKLGFIIDGQRSRRVIVYRTPASIDAQGLTAPDYGKMKIAVER